MTLTIFLDVCRDAQNYVVTKTVAIVLFLFFLAEIFSFLDKNLQNTKLVNNP